MLIAQSKGTWVSFYNKDTTLLGFKDKKGNVTIAPKFTTFTTANKFDDIIAVTEDVKGTWHGYYLTKAGRIIGKDSLHLFDNSPDCESEGFIRFRDPKTDKVGMFNKNGDIVIPAYYNDLSRVRNGMIVALSGAEKIRRGEHFNWKGGKATLIDTYNTILIDSFTFDNDLNFFSVIISPHPIADTIRQHFQGVNGMYYSFIDFDKEFRHWLKSALLQDLSSTRLLAYSYRKINYWKEPNGWTSEAKSSFLKRNFTTIKTTLLQLNAKDCQFTIFNQEISTFDYGGDEYAIFFTNCGEPKHWIYPIKNIVISYPSKEGLIQDNFEFIRTDNGYKLFSVSLSKGNLR
jgi:hypothetical protein